LSQGSTLKSLPTSASRGLKQTCGNEDCSRRFYDLNRTPVACPYCGTPYDAAVVFRHEFVKVVGQRKGKTYRLEEPPVRKIEEDAAEGEIVTEEDDDGAVSTPDVLIDIEDEDEASTEDVLGRETSGEGAA
jgi:uncharacterized protein (TIGR02300 family)